MTRLTTLAVAAAAALLPVPAMAQQLVTFCEADLVDPSGSTAARDFSPIIQASDYDALVAEWKSKATPKLAELNRTFYDNRGQIKASCWPLVDDAKLAADTRTLRMQVTRKSGAVPTAVPFSPTKANASSSARSGSASRPNSSEASAQQGGVDRSTPTAKKGSPQFLRSVALPPPPQGYSGWVRVPFNDFGHFVKVYYTQKASKEEVRVIWACTNESNLDVSCSIGAGEDKTYICSRPGQSLGTTRSLGERATVRAGAYYTFPSDWACRGTGATSVSVQPKVAVEPL